MSWDASPRRVSLSELLERGKDSLKVGTRCIDKSVLPVRTFLHSAGINVSKGTSLVKEDTVRYFPLSFLGGGCYLLELDSFHMGILASKIKSGIYSLKIKQLQLKRYRTITTAAPPPRPLPFYVLLYVCSRV